MMELTENQHCKLFHKCGNDIGEKGHNNLTAVAFMEFLLVHMNFHLAFIWKSKKFTLSCGIKNVNYLQLEYQDKSTIIIFSKVVK